MVNEKIMINKLQFKYYVWCILDENDGDIIRWNMKPFLLLSQKQITVLCLQASYIAEVYFCC